MPASLDESVGNLGVSRGAVEGLQRDARLREVLVNPFWSPERKAFERLHFGQSGFGDFARMGSGFGASPGEPEVEMDPIALFRMRCFREAEERFREGLLRMVQPPSTPRSFASVIEAQGSDQPPKPPPGPPPASPPKVSSNQDGMIPPPPPPLPPVPPMPSFGDDSRGSVGENPNESLRTCDLPKLSEATTALEFGDWLSVVDSHMGDLSYSSGLWWNMVKGAVEVCYQEWLQKSPVDRLRLKPRLEGPANMWPRTERRALSMLLQAVPEHVKDDVISARKLTPDQVLFRLYCLYQPGGASERTKLLQVIADCKSGDTVREVLGWVRNWRRYVGRAKELGITLPDALVLVGVLQQGSEVLSRRSPQVAYRLNMIRQQLSLDQRPNLSSVMTYAEHLQAEAEELTLVGVDETETEKPPKAGGRPSMKMLDGSGTGPGRGGNDSGKGSVRPDCPTPPGAGATSGGSSSVGLCRFWGSDDGCKRGDRCKFSHSRLNPKDNRCFGCSALGHTKAECPVLNQPGELTTGLLDGGATNALRQGLPAEISKAMEVSVELAAGSVKLFQCLETGTLLSPDKVEPIVPLRGLVALGYKIRWDERGCLIFHPQRGRIRCWLRNGCPVVTECHALGLISDIEAHERFKRMGPRLAVGIG